MTRYENLDHFVSLGSVPDGRFAVPYQGVPVDFLYSPVEGAKTTVVVFHGATSGKVSLPWFPGERLLRGVRANRLAISDPTLALDDSYKLTLSWYAGSSAQPRLQYFIESVIRRIQEITGIQNLIFVGGSGGGFAALEASRRFAESVVVAMNPQTSIGKYVPAAVSRYLNISWDGAKSLSDISGHATHNLVESYSPTLRHTVAYVQNTRDRVHINNHQIPFFEKVGDSPKVFMLMDAWGDPEGTGHVVPPHQLVKKIIRHLVAANGKWRPALVDLGFNHLTSALTVQRAVKKSMQSSPSIVSS